MKTKLERPPRAARLSRFKKMGWVSEEEVISFKELYQQESAVLKPLAALKTEPKLAASTKPKEEVVVAIGTGGEPWVAFTPQDRFGLALSGGGIRSATFNLGLLQSLDELGVLKQLDYLATVSGGGYVGGFWTAWLRRGKKPGDEKKFPHAKLADPGECAEVRHLREFSRFLLPRLSALGTEFWNIVMTVLGGLLPSLATALAVLVLMWFAWMSLLAGLMAEQGKEWRAWVMLGFVSSYFIVSEITWRKPLAEQYSSRWKKYLAEHDWRELVGYVWGSVSGAFLIGVGWQFWRYSAQATNMTAVKMMPLWKVEGYETLKNPAVGFHPAVLFILVALVLLVGRALMARAFTGSKEVSLLVGFERAVTRVLRLAGIMLGVAALWWLAVMISQNFSTGGYWLPGTGAGTALSTGLFLWARKWLSEPPSETHGGSLLRTAFSGLKRTTPKILATLSWLLFFVLVGVVAAWWLQTYGEFKNPTHWWLPGQFWWLPIGCALLVVLMILFYDPERMGMHELYRSRIARCYLGASNQKRTADVGEAVRAAMNRSTHEQPQDDLTLAELAGIGSPVHLVCTAANDLSGDPVGTLYRGAKSAVLSVHGISVGNRTAKLDQLRFSSALTASAAAFNSQMGRYSMDLGPAVTFLMTAFNLRLGLWVPHPDNSLRWKFSFPGRFFFYELLGISKADGKNLLLSDGGHFENFGLYELIRRHCRYIIVSDCGADAEVAFDDLANVLRRVREDFGVEVELDVSQLKHGADGLAGQHAVVGTIHYNGLGGMDKGTLLFIKPTITGDEPPDVRQYRTRNVAFPHESTANQFYDEPQWESYRRLGAHTGRVVFEFLDRPENAAATVDHIFRDARSFWYALPENLNDRFIEMSARGAELGQNLSAEGPLQLRREFFSETTELAKKTGDVDGSKSVCELGADDELKVLEFLVRVIQMMEDVWVSGDFEHYWSHPLNEGWMNYFHRWAGTPSFRRWWPVLGPIYSIGFRAFVKERFGIGSVDAEAEKSNVLMPVAAKLHLELLGQNGDYQNSNAWRLFKQSRPNVSADYLASRQILGYTLQLLDRSGVPETAALWVGFVVVRMAADTSAEWIAEDFFVPHMLHGGNIVSNLLDAVIMYYQKQSVTELQVRFGSAPLEKKQPGAAAKPEEAHKSQGLAAAARYGRVRQIEFYKSRGFQYQEPEDPVTGEIVLGKTQAAKPPG